MTRRILPTLEVPGVKYPGRRRVSEIFTELDRQAKNFKDYVVATESMALEPDDDQGIVLAFTIGQRQFRMPMNRRAWLQLAQWLGIPTNSIFYKRLRWGTSEVAKRTNDRGNDRFWPTWINMVNDHLRIIASKRLIRTLKNQDDEWYVRAFLSNRYRIIPNDQLFMAVAEKVKAIGAEFWDARLSEDTFYIYAVAPGISAQVRTDRPFESDGRWVGDAGDTVNAALMLRNSETGQGGCEVCPAIVTKVTGSYFVRQNALSVRHVGSKHEMDALLSLETIKRKNAIVYAEVRDYCASTFDENSFQKLVDRLNEATQDEMPDAVQAAEAVRCVYDLSDARKNAIVNWLVESGDKSRYGLACAVAREAHDNDNLSADEAVVLEQVSTNLVEEQTALKLSRAFESKAKKKSNRAAEEALREAVPKSSARDALGG